MVTQQQAHSNNPPTPPTRTPTIRFTGIPRDRVRVNQDCQQLGKRFPSSMAHFDMHGYEHGHLHTGERSQGWGDRGEEARKREKETGEREMKRLDRGEAYQGCIDWWSQILAPWQVQGMPLGLTIHLQADFQQTTPLWCKTHQMSSTLLEIHRS